MDTVHLHVISSDLVAPRLKHKKHYLSFHPTAGFWLPLETVKQYVKEKKKKLPLSTRQYEQILKGPLIPLRELPDKGTEQTKTTARKEVYRAFPAVKRELEELWESDVRQRRGDSERPGTGTQQEAAACGDASSSSPHIVYRKEDDSDTQSE